jgi:hypothetical protein
MSYNVPSNDTFVDVHSVENVELCWTQLTRYPPAYLLHTVSDGLPVLWAKWNSFCRPLPTQILWKVPGTQYLIIDRK